MSSCSRPNGDPRQRRRRTRLIDHTGETRGYAQILGRARNIPGAAMWSARCLAPKPDGSVCGNAFQIAGGAFRDADTPPAYKCCAVCKPKRRRPQGKRAPDPVPHRKVRRCTRCAGMSHRVEGERCRSCGLAYAPEVIQPTVRSCSPLGFAQRFADGGRG
jgi:hypothetical protein